MAIHKNNEVALWGQRFDRRHRGKLIIAILVSVAFALFVSYKALEASPPSSADLPRIIAKSEGVQPSEVEVLAYEVADGTPAVLYRFTDRPFRSPEGIELPQPLKLSRLTRPFWSPWEWEAGGGGYGWLPKGGAGVSLDLLSASGDTGTVINTTIFGAAIPAAAEIQLTVRGQRYVRDLRPSAGYIILLPDQGVTPDDITDVRVLDADGHELPPPRGYGLNVNAPVSHS